ncbi:hypothetical protein [Psychroserpens damuponensis]|uniref:hypothetical protein n=1 Tax=Psychroserpens damuponensis TaxID=943936 RepID=UPI0005901495|nr:hypothetical protein [Psychroserpens damuponensis]
MKAINSINNIPLHYARLVNHPYGTRGEQRQFSIDSNFLKVLESAFDEVFTNCPLGVPEVVTTAGIFVNKPGQHGHGTAFDLDAVFWKDHTLVSKNFIHQKELYLGIESFLRKHFGIVLNYYYRGHEDHWHVDTSVPVDYHEASKSETLYLQMVLKYIYGKPVIIDGLSGPQTRSYTHDVFHRLNISTPITTKDNYLKFLDITGKVAYKLSEEKTTPLQLLENLETVVNQLPSANKHVVIGALNTFMDNVDTAAWLNEMTHNHDLDAVIDAVLAS